MAPGHTDRLAGFGVALLCCRSGALGSRQLLLVWGRIWCNTSDTLSTTPVTPLATRAQACTAPVHIYHAWQGRGAHAAWCA